MYNLFTRSDLTMQYNNVSIEVGKVLTVILFLLQISWKNTRKILNPRTEK